MKITFTPLLSVTSTKGSSFLVYENSPLREDSQMDSPFGKHKNVSQILATIKFQGEKLPEKPCQ